MNTTPGFFHRLLLSRDAERAHDMAIGALELAESSRVGLALVRRRYRGPSRPRLEQTLLGLRFKNPIGLAAGFDKNARVVNGLSALGFGFVEVGTVTPKPQAGNPKPRIFRHKEYRSLQNALGFNNDGMEMIAQRIAAKCPFEVPVGVNVGKNAMTAISDAESDYEKLFRRFADLGDYFVINVSSPNTPGLRDLQEPERIRGLFELGRALTERPILIKLSPDLEMARARALGRAAVDAGAAGIIVTNTTIDYELIPGAARVGGLSGEVLREKSLQFLRGLAEELYGATVLISVGGVGSGDEVCRRLKAGASLVQLYTSLVYRGPALVGDVLGRMVEVMDRDGIENVSELIGSEVRIS